MSRLETATSSTVEAPYGTPLHPLDHFDVAYFLGTGTVRVPRPEDLDDRSKSDWIAKSIILMQTSWFIAQSIGRLAQHLALTELEIVTLAYAVVNMAIYVVWWKKPYQVKEPIAVYGELPEMNSVQKSVKEESEAFVMWKAFEYLLGVQDGAADLRSLRGTPAFYSGTVDDEGNIALLSILLFSIIGAVFGAVHFLGWSSSFPTPASQLLWRLSAIGLTGAPIAIPVTFLIFIFLSAAAGAVSIIIFGVVLLLLFPLYLFGRAATLVLAFMTLKALPLSAYRAVEWSNLLPHI